MSSLSFTGDTQREPGFFSHPSLCLDTGPHPQARDEALTLCSEHPALPRQLSEARKLSRVYHSPYVGLAAIGSGPLPAPNMLMLSCWRLRDQEGWPGVRVT